MVEDFDNSKLCNGFDIKEFVETNTASANRTRWLTLVLIVATVLIFIGFYNSTKKSWATYRVKSLESFENVPENNYALDNNKPIPLPDDYFGKRDFDNEGKFEGFGLKKFACLFQSSEFKDDTKKVGVNYYIFNFFNVRSQELINQECQNVNSEPNEEFVEAVSGDLNKLLINKFLYKEDRFPCKPNEPANTNQNPQTSLSPTPTPSPSGDKDCVNSNSNTKRSDETEKLIALTKDTRLLLKLEERDVIRLNRLLLEETYPEILKSRIRIPNEEKQATKGIPAWIGYDENVRFIKIPVLGVSIDVNDLGLIGGISFFIILCLLRYSQSREIKNLKISFKEAFYHNQLCHFYHSLAMQQVLTVAPMETVERNKLLAILAKSIYLLPVIVIGFGVGYDYVSVINYNIFEWNFVKWQLYLQILPCFLLIFYMSVRCLERQFHIDRIWDHFYYINRDTPSTLKLKYNAENEKIKTGIFDKKLLEICEYHFSKEPSKEPFWFVTLCRIIRFNLKALCQWIWGIISSPSTIRNWFKRGISNPAKEYESNLSNLDTPEKKEEGKP